ncbi:MAG TPA: homocysteine S-methyltransferase family protein [Myxococcales bacterium]|nr:homocysteine S-methyltransferase family protein [Myxococcales bacterium]
MNELAQRLGISRPLLLDGGMGTALIARGLEPHSERAPTWSLVHPREVTAVHRAQVEAGAELVLTNTFSETAPTPQEAHASLRLAHLSGARYVAGSVWADLPPADVERSVQALATADAIWLETATSAYSARRAVNAACGLTDAPVVATLAFTLLGTDGWEAALIALADAGASAVGFNCSPWPRAPGALARIVKQIVHATGVPVVLKPDAAGLTAEAWSAEVHAAIRAGALLVGGCCGATDQHLAALRARLRGRAG